MLVCKSPFLQAYQSTHCCHCEDKGNLICETFQEDWVCFSSIFFTLLLFCHCTRDGGHSFPFLLSLAAEERSQGEEGGGGGWGLGGGGVLDDVLRVGLVLLEDHEDGGFRHAVHAAVVQDVALGLLDRGADVGGAASDELAHQHPSQEHGVGVAVGFAIVVGVRSVPGKVAPCKDTRVSLWPENASPPPANRARPTASTLPTPPVFTASSS